MAGDSYALRQHTCPCGCSSTEPDACPKCGTSWEMAEALAWIVEQREKLYRENASKAIPYDSPAGMLLITERDFDPDDTEAVAVLTDGKGYVALVTHRTVGWARRSELSAVWLRLGEVMP